MTECRPIPLYKKIRQDFDGLFFVSAFFFFLPPNPHFLCCAVSAGVEHRVYSPRVSSVYWFISVLY